MPAVWEEKRFLRPTWEECWSSGRKGGYIILPVLCLNFLGDSRERMEIVATVFLWLIKQNQDYPLGNSSLGYYYNKLLCKKERVVGYSVLVLRKGTWQRRQAQLAHYDPLLKDYTMKVKCRFPGFIPEKCDQLAEFSLWRSGRRGSTTEAGNQKVEADLIEMNIRFRKNMKAKGEAVFQNMWMVDTNVRATLLSWLY